MVTIYEYEIKVEYGLMIHLYVVTAMLCSTELRSKLIIKKRLTCFRFKERCPNSSYYAKTIIYLFYLCFLFATLSSLAANCSIQSVENDLVPGVVSQSSVHEDGSATGVTEREREREREREWRARVEKKCCFLKYPETPCLLIEALSTATNEQE